MIETLFLPYAESKHGLSLDEQTVVLFLPGKNIFQNKLKMYFIYLIKSISKIYLPENKFEYSKPIGKLVICT